MLKPKIGDIFALPLPNHQYLCSRILLDIEQQCFQSNLISEDSPLDVYRGLLLVEVYQKISKEPIYSGNKRTLIPGFFIDPEPIESEEWQIVDHNPVDPIKVEFPETLVINHGLSCFQRGEIRLELPEEVDIEKTEGLDIYPTITSPYKLPRICLYYLGLIDLLTPVQKKTSNLKKMDLRFSEYRSQIYQMLGEDENQSYYEMSSRLGYNISRFY